MIATTSTVARFAALVCLFAHPAAALADAAADRPRTAFADRFGTSFGGSARVVAEAMARVRAGSGDALVTVDLADGATATQTCPSRCGKRDITLALTGCGKAGGRRCRILAVSSRGRIEQVHFPALPEASFD